jgi:hypothetical protein
VLRRIGGDVDVVTYLGDYTRRRLEPALGPAATLAQLPSGVDTDLFHPGSGGGEVRRRWGLDRPAGGGVREPAGAAQGPGRAHPGAAADPAAGARRRPARGRRRP